MPLGFTHGDFWPGNIFEADGRLSAVPDWDDSSPHGLPFTDALDFAATMAPGRGNVDPGPRLMNWLWPMIQEPPDDLGGLRPDDVGLSIEMAPHLLTALVVAYWLERISRQLEGGYRSADRRWLAGNLPRSARPHRQGTAVTTDPSAAPASQSLVLCYHTVDPEWNNMLAVESDSFGRQISGLLEDGYESVGFTEAVDSRGDGRKLLAITFDDGYKSTRNHAAPILAELGAVATVFVVTDYMSDTRPFAWAGVDHLAV